VPAATPVPSPTAEPIWFQLPIPPGWQWAGFILSVVALLIGVMALPTVLQMFHGGPRLEVEFAAAIGAQGGEKWLSCHIFNRPVKNSVLRCLGVRRESLASVFVVFDVCKDGSLKYVASSVPVIRVIASNGIQGKSVSLPVSDLPAEFPIVVARTDGTAVVERFDEGRQPLAPGRYRVEVQIVAGEMRIRRKAAFAVGIGDGLAGCYWTHDS
jgi:hypothetical protein